MQCIPLCELLRWKWALAKQRQAMERSDLVLGGGGALAGRNTADARLIDGVIHIIAFQQRTCGNAPPFEAFGLRLALFFGGPVGCGGL
jgi:hypothetical protein